MNSAGPRSETEESPTVVRLQAFTSHCREDDLRICNQETKRSLQEEHMDRSGSLSAAPALIFTRSPSSDRWGSVSMLERRLMVLLCTAAADLVSYQGGNEFTAGANMQQEKTHRRKYIKEWWRAQRGITVCLQVLKCRVSGGKTDFW